MTAAPPLAQPEAPADFAAKVCVSVLPAAVGAVGALYAWQGFGYGLGALDSPGPGALPFAIGIATALVSVGVVAGAWKRPAVPAATDDGDSPAVSRFPVSITLLIAAVTCAAVIWQARIIGLLPAAALAAVILAWTMRVRLWVAALAGLAFYVLGHLLFERWLEVNLPNGYF